MSNIWARSLQMCKKSTPLIKNSLLAKTVSPINPIIARNLWALSTSTRKNLSKQKTAITCACNGLHTEGDQIFVDVLKEEIEAEKEMQRDIPKMSDSRWNLVIENAQGEIQGNFNGDNISVSFNLNNCVPPMEEEPTDTEEEALVAYPDFNVQIKKDGHNDVVEFDCFYSDPAGDGVSTNEFNIRSMTIHSGEVKASTFMVDTDNLDPRIYSYFMAYLADRGIDNQFADELSQLATSAENTEYIKTLEKFKSFILCK